jgi:uncharacterized protein
MKSYSFKNLAYILPIILFVFLFIFVSLDKMTKSTYSHGEQNVIIGDKPITVMVVDEIGMQWQGLSDRGTLGADNGMLFVFPNLQKRTFVMRRMHFPLDIIWISGNKVISIDKRLGPEGEKPTKYYSATEPVDNVLEVNGGFTDAFGIKVGDRVQYNLK